MHNDTRSRGGRLAAGVAALALGAITAIGGALPASAAPNIDPADTGSLTIHKFEQPAEMGTPSTGGPVDTTGLRPLDGVEFTVSQVTSIDLSSNEGWLATEGLTARDVLDDPDAHELGAPRVGTTDERGALAFDELPLGVYLVQETGNGGHAIAAPAQPFLVSIPLPQSGGAWLYDVHVYPKNALTHIEKSVDDASATGLGSRVTWTIENTVPLPSEGNRLDAYSIGDTLDERLALESIRVRLDGAALTEGAEYTVSTEGGETLVTFTPRGLELLRASGGATILVDVVTTVESIGDGAIVNEAVVYINDPTRSSGFESNPATSHWGAVRIVKHAQGDATALLQGATFEVRDANGALVSVDGQTRFTTGANGEVLIEGLRTTAAGQVYTLHEVAAPTGYVLDETPFEVTVMPGSLGRATVATIENAQAPAFTLPITGGEGTVAFVVGGGALLLVALGALLVQTSRRRAASAQH